MARRGILLLTPPPSLHCIPDGTCSIALLGEGPFCPREPTPNTFPTLEPGPPFFGNWGVAGGNMSTRGDMCISFCLPVHMGLQDRKDLPEWHPFSWYSPDPAPCRIEVFLGYFYNMASGHNSCVAKFPGLVLYSPHSHHHLIKE